MELNAKKIKKALECCASEEYICTQCPIDEKIKDDCECGKVVARNALSLINSQEQRIGAQDMTISELRQRAEKAEHDADRYASRIEAYRQELAEVRVALAEANNDKKKLTEEIKNLEQAYECADSARRELSSKCDELTEENERLKLADSIASVSVPEALKIINEYCESYIKKAKADTVRKMQERLISEFRKDDRMNYYIRMTLDQIAKEMLEGGD